MKKKSLISIAYALLILIGGILGYIFAGSFASLLSSSLFALSLLGSVWLLEKDNKGALGILILLTAILFLFFGYRFLLSYRFFPSGVMALISLFTLLRLFKRETSCK